MTRLNKHIISIFLMCSSIALLLLFQFFWLRQVYKDQRTWLKKEAESLFHDAVMESQDSLFQKNMNTMVLHPNEKATLPQHFKADTFVYVTDNETRIWLPNTPKPNIRLDSTMSRYSFSFASTDSLKKFKPDSNKRMLRLAPRLPIAPDSIRSIQVNRMLQRVVMNVQNTQGKEIIIQINNDTLSLDSVRVVFSKKLKNADLPISFVIKKVQKPSGEITDQGLQLMPIPTGIPPRDFFQASIIYYDTYLLQRTLPQFLFSLFLILITSLAFWLIYRNLRQQERLTALKNDFISNITHELKTPIATVSVAIEALSNFNALQNPQLTKEYLDISKNELNRLTILVDKVLKMSIFEQKEPELQLELVNVKDLVQQITASMRLQFEKYHAEVNIQSEGENFIIEGDRLHLTSVIYNLVDNALKYSPEDPKININVEQQNGHLNLLVQDNGIGIAPEYRNRIFEKFFRVPTGDVHNVKGYGLGLNYVASVVQKHGGKIEVESAPGQGSCFTVSLPRKN